MIYRHLSSEIFARFYAFCFRRKFENIIVLSRFCGKFLVFFILSIGILEAYNFDKCKEFYRNTSQIFSLNNGKTIRAIHIGEGKYLAFSKENSSDSIKYDNFTHLLLLKGQNRPQKYTFTSHKNAPKLVAITENNATSGKILQKGKSLKDNAIFSSQIPANAVISDICYQALGISVGGDKLIDTPYIERFLRDKNDKIYSDIGISVKNHKNAIIVESINPFTQFSKPIQTPPAQTPAKSLQIGDEILLIGDVKIKDEYHFFDIISNLNITQTTTITAKRNGKIIKSQIQPFKRERAFDDKGTVLDFFGIIVDDNLMVLKSPKIFKPNDRILRINQIKISNKMELDSAIKEIFRQDSTQKTAQDLSFLIVRDDFEFFITINGAKFE